MMSSAAAEKRRRRDSERESQEKDSKAACSSSTNLSDGFEGTLSSSGISLENSTFDGEHPPKPYPKDYSDVWDNDHVRMPCSPNPSNCCEMMPGDEPMNRWKVIKKALTSNIKSWHDLKDAILSYNNGKTWQFSNLQTLMEELDVSERVSFIETTLPKMVHLALNLPNICTRPIPFLKKHSMHTISISQLQAASLLANAFFCTFPGRNRFFENYPTFNFSDLFNEDRREKRREAQREKLKCLFHYFKRVTDKEPCGTLSFKRRHLSVFPSWDTSKKQFTKLHVTSVGGIEDSFGMLQVDFANKRIGGGVLNSGCVQEEIRFVVCPELIVSRLFTAELSDDEAVIITGCERFSNYVGYSDSFRYSGDYLDPVPWDEWGRRTVDVVVIDATRFFSNKNEQFKEKFLKREVDKAYCGFFSTISQPEHIPSIATGNWGCGAFKGDPYLKSLLQLMAASEANRDVTYYTFGDSKLCKEIYGIHSILREKGVTIGFVWKVLNEYNSKYIEPKSKNCPSLYDFLRQMVHIQFSETKINNEKT